MTKGRRSRGQLMFPRSPSGPGTDVISLCGSDRQVHGDLHQSFIAAPLRRVSFQGICMPLKTASRAARMAILSSFAAAGLLAVSLVAGTMMFDQARQEAGRQRAAASSVAGRISLGDERMTLATRLAAETGDPQWARLYEKTGKELDRALEEAKQLASAEVEKHFVSATKLPVARLYELERAAIALGLQGRPDEARKLINNPAYDALRARLIYGTQHFVVELSTEADANVASVRSRHILVIALICMLAAIAFAVLWRVLTTYTARAEAAQRQMQAEIAQLQLESGAEAAKTDAVAKLAGGIAHEFNNLLAVVIGNLDLLDSQLPERGEVRQQLEEALAASLKGAELTHHLLAFGRNQPLFEEQTDLNALIASTGSELAKTAPSGVALELELGPDVLPVNIDPAQFRKALEGLVTNSVEAMPAGGRILIRTEASRGAAAANGKSRHEVSVWISDTGAGIAAENLDRVFEPFFSTKAGASRGGLGMSMVYGFVKQCGGHVEVLSKVGYGTTVCLSFPLAKETKPPRLKPAQAGASDHSAKLILVVDDDEAVRSTVAAQLFSLGYRTAQAVDGRDALRQVDRNPNISLVLTDLMMPGMNGFELGRELSARSRSLQILYTSGFTREAVAGYDVPPERFLAKPYRKKDLAQKLQHLLMAA